MSEYSGLNRGAYTIFPVWILIGIFLAASLIHQKSDMVLLCLAVLLIISLAWFWSRYLRSGISFEMKTGRCRVFPDDTYTLELTVHNDNFIPAWIRAAPPADLSQNRLDEDNSGNLNTALRWHETAHFQWPLKAGKRGVYQIGPGQIIVGDLLGFFPRIRPTEASAELIVYPRLVPTASLELAKLEFFGTPARGSLVDDPVYLWGTRDYQPGRPARFIHWRASVRHRRWQEKVFEPSAQTKIVFVLSAAGFVEHADRDGFERAIEILASLAVKYQRDGFQVDLITDASMVGVKYNPRKLSDPKEPLAALLERLARMQLRTEKPLLAKLIKDSNGLSHANVIHFSRQFDQPSAQARTFFRHLSVPAAFVVNQAEMAGSDKRNISRARLHLLSDIGMEAEA